MKVQGPDGKIIQFPDGTPPDQIKAAITKHYAAAKPVPSLIETPSPAERFRNMFVAGLPSVGGFVGGIAGGIAGLPEGGVGAVPGAIAGAGIGGAGGKAIQDVFLNRPHKPMDIALAGGDQAAMQALGEGAARGVAGVARGAMDRALHVAGTTAEDFPHITQSALSERLLPTRQDAKIAMRKMGASGDKLMQMLENAKQGGVTLPTSNVTADVTDYLARPEVPNKVKAAIAQDLQDFVGQHGETIDPVTLKKIKQVYWEMGRSALNAQADRGAVGGVGQPHPTFAKLIAKGAQRELEGISGYGPIGPQERATQKLIGLEEALRTRAYAPPRDLYLHSPETWVTPTAKARLALFLNRPGVQSTARQTPRTLYELFNQARNSAAADATQP